MRSVLLAGVLFLLSACAPTLPPQQLPGDCRGEFSGEQLRRGQWLQGSGVWRLRQGALLEVGMKKLPLEGFLRLDLEDRTARLMALNEIGLVLFDLQVDATGYQLLRAVPQLQSRESFIAGIARSLRRTFLQRPLSGSEPLTAVGGLQELRVPADSAAELFGFDCRGDLRELRPAGGDWLVRYNRYREYSGQRLPEEMIYYDRGHALKLSLWLREARQEP